MFDSAIAVIKIFRVKELSIEILLKSANPAVLDRKSKSSMVLKKGSIFSFLFRKIFVMRRL